MATMEAQWLCPMNACAPFGTVWGPYPYRWPIELPNRPTNPVRVDSPPCIAINVDFAVQQRTVERLSTFKAHRSPHDLPRIHWRKASDTDKPAASAICFSALISESESITVNLCFLVIRQTYSVYPYPHQSPDGAIQPFPPKTPTLHDSLNNNFLNIGH